MDRSSHDNYGRRSSWFHCKKAMKNMLPMQPGDVEEACADVDALMWDVGFRPDTPIEVGVTSFLEWFGACFNESTHQFPKEAAG